MEERLKKRLVGAAVLTSLVVIFVPMLFENDSGDNRSGELMIPPRPDTPREISTSILPAPEEDLSRAPAPALESLEPPEIEPIPEPKPARKAAEPDPVVLSVPKPPVKPKPVKAPGPRAWILQVGSFSSKKNADQLVKRLRAKKFPAFHEQATVNRKTVFRVRVGPELDRKLAERMQDRIAKDFKLKGQLVRHP